MEDGDKVKNLLSVIFSVLLVTACTSSIFQVYSRANSKISIQNGTNTSCVEAANHGALGQKAIVYGGLALGASLGGLAGNKVGAEGAITGATLSYVMLSLIASHLAEPHWQTMAPFALATLAHAAHINIYVSTMQSVPEEWSVLAGMAGFGMACPMGRSYAVLLTKIFTAKDVLFWNCAVVLVVYSARRWLSTPKDTSSGEVLECQNVDKKDKANLAALLILWIAHGFIVYLIVYLDDLISNNKSQLTIACLTVFAKMHSAQMARKLGQKRAILTVQMCLCGLALVVITVALASNPDTWHAQDLTVSLIRCTGFLISGCWNLLWLLTVQSVQANNRQRECDRKANDQFQLLGA